MRRWPPSGSAIGQSAKLVTAVVSSAAGALTPHPQWRVQRDEPRSAERRKASGQHGHVGGRRKQNNKVCDHGIHRLVGGE